MCRFREDGAWLLSRRVEDDYVVVVRLCWWGGDYSCGCLFGADFLEGCGAFEGFAVFEEDMGVFTVEKCE